MSAPITCPVPSDLLASIVEALTECADDLGCHIDTEYPEDLRAYSPSHKRRHHRDSEPVRKARLAIAAIKHRWPNLGQPPSSHAQAVAERGQPEGKE